MNKVLTLAFAVVLPFGAFAQQYDLAGMQASLSSLEQNAARILDDNGFVDVDPTTLSLSTIAEIVDVARNDDERAGTVRGGIQAALNRWRPPSE
ncbi:hypothetical protein [Cognatiyoonia sp. IB215182]|uniref:hypothetical protein n=1 Tax=Cognatiyoonia sp. IB215182 TaxID=3097353 RepID=UPI002A1802FA|nr:hypothetical protein [Cognatiyoonia sp. IB215182]MDX8350869.1 hypothetical protein [Cognatiyoonia sp. IB215182]